MISEKPRITESNVYEPTVQPKDINVFLIGNKNNVSVLFEILGDNDYYDTVVKAVLNKSDSQSVQEIKTLVNPLGYEVVVVKDINILKGVVALSCKHDPESLNSLMEAITDEWDTTTFQLCSVF